MQMESQVIQVNLDDIIPNRFQPRIAFDEKALNELAASIKEHGVIQPLVLRKLGKKYEIIAGERRYKASIMAGLETVPAVISNIDDNKSAEVALVENIQRKDLTAIEEARSYKNLLDKGYLTQEQLAKKMGLSQSAVSNKLRLLNLDNKVQQALLDNKISERHARSLLKVPSGEEQQKMLNRIIKERLTVKQLDEIIKKEYSSDENDDGDVPLVKTPNIDEIKEQATDINQKNEKNIANMLVSEDTMTEYSEDLSNQNLNNNVNEINNNPSPVDAPAMPTDTATTVNPFAAPVMDNNQEVLKAVPPTSNKFFNPLEDSPVTMDNLNPFANDASFSVDQTPAQDSEVEIFDVPNTNTAVNSEPISTEPVNNLNQVNNDMSTPVDNSNIINTPINNVTSNPTDINSNPISQEPTPNIMNELNPNNKFFQPIQEQSGSNMSIDSDMYTVPSPVNPMDNVDGLVNGHPQIDEQTESLSLGEAINGIREMVSDLNNKGLNVNIDEADLEASYQMNISIMK